MSRYQQLMTEVLDSIFEGYTMEGGKLSVVNEDAAKKATDTLHTLVLEKSRDLWDQLEASSDSLAEYSDEINFEEMAADPSSIANTVSFRPDEDEVVNDADVDVDEMDMDDDMDYESNDTFEAVSNLLGSEQINFDEIFTEHGHDHLDDEESDDEPSMPFENHGDDDSEEEMVDGDEDYDDLMMGMDDAGMGSSDMESDMNDDSEDDELELDDAPEGLEDDSEDDDSEDGFDFDLDLESDDLDDDDEELVDGMGHHDKSYRIS